jgi:hypothetical protein
MPPPSDDPAANPYAAPSATLDAPPAGLASSAELAEAEATRTACIGREMLIKLLGGVHGLFAALTFGLLAWILLVDQIQNRATMKDVVVNTLMYLIFGTVQAALGLGLYRLRAWARWAETALVGLLAAVVLLSFVGGLAQSAPGEVLAFEVVIVSTFGAILYLLHGRKGALVFTPGYRGVIALTPHVRLPAGAAVKLALMLALGLLAVIVFAVIG